MPKNSYFKTVASHENLFNLAGPQMVYAFTQFLRGPIEVFLRRDWGLRHFHFTGTLLWLLLLSAFPIWISDMWEAVIEGKMLSFNWRHFFLLFASWYTFLILSFDYWRKRRREVKEKDKVLDFKHYTLSSGYILPLFATLHFKTWHPTIRQIEKWLEPALFALIGLCLCVLLQPVGILLIAFSLMYSFSYYAQYSLGDTFILNKIDETICNMELAKTMLESREGMTESGFRFYGRKPVDPESRRKLADLVTDSDDEEDNEAR